MIEVALPALEARQILFERVDEPRSILEVDRRSAVSSDVGDCSAR